MFGRDSAAINLLIKGEGREFERCMKLVDNALLPYGARPHWGKNHVKDAAAFASLYPKWKHFTQLRRELDPEGVFLNDYLQSLFMSGD
jgi:L-gulonolactone oxidase